MSVLCGFDDERRRMVCGVCTRRVRVCVCVFVCLHAKRVVMTRAGCCDEHRTARVPGRHVRATGKWCVRARSARDGARAAVTVSWTVWVRGGAEREAVGRAVEVGVLMCASGDQSVGNGEYPSAPLLCVVLEG